MGGSMISGRTAGRSMSVQIDLFIADEGGATAIEYAMIACGVGACIASTVWSLGASLKTTFYDKLASIFP
jgi:Flp pilus assembly pilin Flp